MSWYEDPILIKILRNIPKSNGFIDYKINQDGELIFQFYIEQVLIECSIKEEIVSRVIESAKNSTIITASGFITPTGIKQYIHSEYIKELHANKSKFKSKSFTDGYRTHDGRFGDKSQWNNAFDDMFEGQNSKNFHTNHQKEQEKRWWEEMFGHAEKSDENNNFGSGKTGTSGGRPFEGSQDDFFNARQKQQYQQNKESQRKAEEDFFNGFKERFGFGGPFGNQQQQKSPPKDDGFFNRRGGATRMQFIMILELNSVFTSAELKTAFRKKASEWHPDRNQHRLEEATTMMQKINASYAYLSK